MTRSLSWCASLLLPLVAGLSVLRPARVGAAPLPSHGSAAADRAAGRALFQEKGCEHCHGVDGVGGEKGPNLSGVGRTLKPAMIEKQILNGGEAMPPFADVLQPDEVQKLVEYLSAKKKVVRAPKPTATKSAPSAAKPNTGGSDDQ